jgi:hypothetical protein
MGEAILRYPCWDGPPTGFQVNILPAHGAHFAATLRCQQPQLEIGVKQGMEGLTGVPDGSDLLLIEDTIALAFFARSFDLETGKAKTSRRLISAAFRRPHCGSTSLARSRASFRQLFLCTLA